MTYNCVNFFTMLTYYNGTIFQNISPRFGLRHDVWHHNTRLIRTYTGKKNVFTVIVREESSACNFKKPVLAVSSRFQQISTLQVGQQSPCANLHKVHTINISANIVTQRHGKSFKHSADVDRPYQWWAAWACRDRSYGSEYTSTCTCTYTGYIYKKITDKYSTQNR